MSFQIIFTGITFGIVALIMFGIGITQIRSKDPVGFYSGIKPPAREELTDVDVWNKKHGTMYIAYGICIVASWVCGLVIGDSIFAVIPYTVGLLVPVIIMVIYHHRLVKKYKK